MGYFNRYASRINYLGDSEKSRLESVGVKDFAAFLDRSPAKEKVVADGAECDVVIQTMDSSEPNNRIVLSHVDDFIHVGTILEWPRDSSKWIVVDELNRAKHTYSRYVISKCEYTLRWRDVDTNDVLISPACLFKPMLQTTETNEFVRQRLIINVPTGKLIVVIPKKDTTKTIKIDNRFILEGGVWEVDAIDNISKKNLIYLTLEKVAVDPARDNIQDEISDINFKPSTVNNQVSEYTYTINGPSQLIVGESYNYTISKKNGVDVLPSIFTYFVDGNSISLASSDENSAIIKGLSLGSSTLIIKENDIEVVSKTIKVVNFL